MRFVETWDLGAEEVLEMLERHLGAKYVYDKELFADYGRMLADAVRCGDEASIVCHAWYCAIEAARGLDTMRLWDVWEMKEILVSKQHDYGHDNINSFGQIGIAVRLSDKIARYYNLDKRNVVALNEPFVDCLRDMVGYGVLSAMLANDTFNLKLEADL
jgi:hypothetical protein